MQENYIKGTIDRIEGQKAVLSLDGGQKLNWPIEKLPENCAEGSVIKLILTSGGENAEDEKNLLAKNILNEILNVAEK